MPIVYETSDREAFQQIKTRRASRLSISSNDIGSGFAKNLRELFCWKSLSRLVINIYDHNFGLIVIQERFQLFDELIRIKFQDEIFRLLVGPEPYELHFSMFEDLEFLYLSQPVTFDDVNLGFLSLLQTGAMTPLYDCPSTGLIRRCLMVLPV